MEQIIVAILIIVFGVFVFKKMNENNQEDGSYNQFSDGPRIKHSKKIYDLMKRVGRVSANEVGPLIQKRQKIHDEVVAEVFEEEFYPTEAIDEINRRLASRADFATPIFVDCALSVRFESSMDDDDYDQKNGIRDSGNGEFNHVISHLTRTPVADYIPKGKGGWKTYIARAKGIKLCEEIKPFLLKPEDGIQKTVLVLRFQSISIRYDDEGEYPEDLSPSDLKMVKVSETTLDDVIRCTTESGSLNDSFNTPQSIKAVFGA